MFILICKQKVISKKLFLKLNYQVRQRSQRRAAAIFVGKFLANFIRLTTRRIKVSLKQPVDLWEQSQTPSHLVGGLLHPKMQVYN